MNAIGVNSGSSWGGIPGVASIEGHSIDERSARGEKGGVKSILLIASAMIMEKGASLSETNGTRSVDFMDFDVRNPVRPSFLSVNKY